MKLQIQLIAMLLATASAGLAMGCGCASQKVRLEPVREQVITHSSCAIQQPLVSSRTAYVPECPSCAWVPPDTSHPAYVVGNVLTAPFRLITGRSLGQPDVVSSFHYTEPVGEKITTIRSTKHFNKCGDMTKKVTIRDSMLEPVGERLTTVKVIRTKPLLQPVGEQVTTIRRVEMQPVMEPVGEKTIIQYSKPSCLAPVGERTIIRYSKPACLAPVGERTIIRYSQPSWCD
ncbi:MAG: hypothetical protein PHQ12_13765 [Chthoniobacteraceae bacterium]|nr:hypothetical protein [Chthoniobacteraceae bacterium]